MDGIEKTPGEKRPDDIDFADPIMPLSLLEHINLNILDEPTARKFYVEGLGAVVNAPSTNDRQLHVNMGVSQFHLLLQYSTVEAIKPVTAAQCWAGEIELWTTEPLGEIEERLKKLDFQPERPSDDCLKVQCPWGNHFLLREESPVHGGRTWGSHPSGSGTLSSMPRVVHAVPPGAASRLQAFWTDIMGASDVELMPSGTPAAWDGVEGVEGHQPAADGLTQCVVRFGTEPQQLVFAERHTAPPFDAYLRSESAAYHICVYVDDAASFKSVFRKCEESGLLYANPVYARSPPQFGNALSWEEAEQCGQFRIKDLGGGGSTGEAPALVLEMEIRSPKHVSCPLGRRAATPDAKKSPTNKRTRE